MKMWNCKFVNKVFRAMWFWAFRWLAMIVASRPFIWFEVFVSKWKFGERKLRVFMVNLLFSAYVQSNNVHTEQSHVIRAEFIAYPMMLFEHSNFAFILWYHGKLAAQIDFHENSFHFVELFARKIDKFSKQFPTEIPFLMLFVACRRFPNVCQFCCVNACRYQSKISPSNLGNSRKMWYEWSFSLINTVICMHSDLPHCSHASPYIRRHRICFEQRLTKIRLVSMHPHSQHGAYFHTEEHFVANNKLLGWISSEQTRAGIIIINNIHCGWIWTHIHT